MSWFFKRCSNNRITWRRIGLVYRKSSFWTQVPSSTLPFKNKHLLSKESFQNAFNETNAIFFQCVDTDKRTITKRTCAHFNDLDISSSFFSAALHIEQPSPSNAILLMRTKILSLMCSFLTVGAENELLNLFLLSSSILKWRKRVFLLTLQNAPR